MTRDQAIQKVYAAGKKHGEYVNLPSAFVDALIALDLLRVDPPEAGDHVRAVAVLRDQAVAVHTVMPSIEPHLQGIATARLSGMGAINVLDILKSAGFQIMRTR